MNMCLEMVSIITTAIEDNPFTQSASLLHSLREAGIHLSIGQLRRARDSAGFERRLRRKGFKVSSQNEQKRVQYCERLLASGEDYLHWVFTDECTVQLGGNGRWVWVRKDDPTAHIIGADKFPPKIMVWAGISARGATQIVLLRGGMHVDSELYCRVLEQAYLPFTQVILSLLFPIHPLSSLPYPPSLFSSLSILSLLFPIHPLSSHPYPLSSFPPPGPLSLNPYLYRTVEEIMFSQKAYPLGDAVLVQDGAPSHRSLQTKAFLSTNNIRCADHPAQSPDLNMIEQLWSLLKMKVCNQIFETCRKRLTVTGG